MLRSGASERGCACVREVPDVTLRTDATLLRRIIDNLVSNAIRFSRSGGILVALRPRRDHVLLQIWDQGSGIAAANLPLIFDEFYQVKRSDVAQGGMGLGSPSWRARFDCSEVTSRSVPVSAVAPVSPSPCLELLCPGLTT